MRQHLLALTALLVGAALLRAQAPAGAPEPEFQGPLGPPTVPAITDLPSGLGAPQTAPLPTPVPPSTDRGSGVFAPADPTGSTRRFWASGEYLMWWVKASPVPVPLASSGNPNDVNPGAIGQPGTNVLLGGGSVGEGMQSGGRFRLGYALDCAQTFGIEGGYFFLGQAQRTQSIASNGSPGSATIGVPFSDPTGLLTANGAPGQVFAPLSTPGVSSGNAFLTTATRLQGAELNGSMNLYSRSNLRIDALAGFRWLNLTEGLEFGGSSTGLAGGPAAGQFTSFNDQFNTNNNFYGGQVGARMEYTQGKWSLAGSLQVALGVMNETVDIAGNSTVVLPGTATYAGPGGFFAAASNSGHFSRDRFAVVPEANFKVGYQVTTWAQLFVGYSFIYVNEVARPGNQMDHTVNVTQLPLFLGSPANFTGPARPGSAINGSDFWAQGVNFGVLFRF